MWRGVTYAITKPTVGTLRLSTTGALPAGTLIGGIEVTVELPGFLTGEFVSIKCDVATTVSFPTAAAFKILNISVLDGTTAANSLNSTVQGATDSL